MRLIKLNPYNLQARRKDGKGSIWWNVVHIDFLTDTIVIENAHGTDTLGISDVELHHIAPVSYKGSLDLSGK